MNAKFKGNPPTIFKCGSGPGWSGSIIPFPQMICGSGMVHRIRIKEVKFAGNGFIGIAPLEEWKESIVGSRSASLMSLKDSYHVQYDGPIRHGKIEISVPSAKRGNVYGLPGATISMTLNLVTSTLSWKVWQKNEIRKIRGKNRKR